MQSNSPPSGLNAQLTELCYALVAIPSVTGDEAAVCDHMERWARACGKFPSDHVHRAGNGLVVGRPSPQRPCVALAGHLDTVPKSAAYGGPCVQGDRLEGLGASDMKGSIAVMMALVENLDLESLPFDVMLVLYDREEGPYADNGLQPLLEECSWLRDIDLAIAMEPTDNTLQLGCIGSLQARIHVQGQAAHSARPWQGHNAIHAAGPLLTALLSRPHAETSVAGLSFREAMSVTLAEGGRARNVVPDSFTLNLNYRFPPPGPGDSIGAAVQRAKAVVEAMVTDSSTGVVAPARVDIEFIDVAPPGTVPGDNAILGHLRACTTWPVQPKQAWTDVARLALEGIDAINLGPGMGAQAHQVGEWISISDMRECYDGLARALSTPLK